MARVRTVDFLPEIFQTSTNKQFLSATLDQLVQEPQFKKIQGFVGRRVGPGVNPNDSYVAESTDIRSNYQLEPGVVIKNSNSNQLDDAITYPGIIDALALQGANVDRADRLFTSDYYTWDPFVDLDKFVNFSQYYWLPSGPDSVDVFAGSVPLTNTFEITRANGNYTFSGLPGTNPTLTLVRGGNYKFNVAQNDKETVNFRVTNQSTSAYVIDFQSNPTLTLVRGNTYVFNLVLDGLFPFWIKTQPGLTKANSYDSGVTNNGAVEGLVTFVVPQDAPDTLYYSCSTEVNMTGTFRIIDATPGTGPGFWIQTDPGINGRIPSTPNISSRDVLGVVNNGEDLGTVTFNVPLSTEQSFYYTLDTIDNVDLVTNLLFNQINNQSLTQFINTYGGIDGITSLNGLTLIFQYQDAGWERTVLGDPFAATEIPESERYGIWQIQIVTIDGTQYITLVSLRAVENFKKFSISYGTQYSSTQWYKNAESYFEEIPLLTAVKDVLFYQDGTDPEIFGQIRLIDEEFSSTLDVDDIIGKKNYTSPNGVVFTNGLKVQFVGSVVPAEYQNKEYYVEGVGTAIKLLPVQDFVTPETYTKSATVPYDSTPYDVGNYDASLNQPLVPDYLTINRASSDLNAWTRSNRWFHIDVINASAEYNNTVAVVDNNFRAKRPILEFRAGTRLFNFGTQGKQPVDIIDFQTTDALSSINGSLGYSVDGYNFISGTRVIFASDTDPQVRNKVYTVEFITPDSVPPLISQPVINLVPAADSTVLINQTVVSLSGVTQQGKSFYYDGVAWLPAQEKTGVNQAPLFDVYDQAGVSFGNREKFPSTNFRGSKLFSYAVGSGVKDPVLGFALKYLSLTNVGDIVFDNNLYNDTFVYTKDSVSTTEPISQGYVRQYENRVNFVKEIGWQPAVIKSLCRQQFRFTYTGQPLKLDVRTLTNLPVPGVQLYVGANFQDPSTYQLDTTDNSTTITLPNTHAFGSIVEVDVISDQASSVAFYTVPINLSNNPFNVNSRTFTLGTVRSHYESIGENLTALSGPINGANNTRDLGNIIPYGTNILQQSSPLTLAGYFMRSEQYNIFNALNYNSREYEKFKAQLLDIVVRNDYTNYDIPQMLTAAINDINVGRTQINPFYWSDMLPASTVYTQTQTTVTPITTDQFNLSRTYDFTSSNYFGLLVYLNGRLLTINYDYVVSPDSPRLTVTVPLAVGDVVTIQEFSATYGNFVPNTPTKMGLYPAFKPEIYLDTTYINPTFVIQGHDGSKTVAFGDFRDDLLLEFETRIYNNLKIKSRIPLTMADVIPGQFRTTDYSLSEINEIMSLDFLSWIGWNKLDYQQQDYSASNEFTWNYSASSNKLTGTSSIDQLPLPAGAWRGIYRYFYDTDYPNTRPWEMLGFSEEPAWWQDVYGPAPYTSGNLVLWDDLAQGRVADPRGEYFRPQYARPGLQQAIPVDSEGQLLSPFETVVGQYDSSQFQKSWVFGDGGPVEATWFKSSSYPFAIMRLYALTRPAEFFALFADRDLYKFDSDYNQYLYNNRYRLDANGVQVYGNGVSKASFINWIVDYNQQLGRDSTTALKTDLANLDVRLCYRVGSFTDKQYTKIYTEKSSPNSLNSSLLLPDESYNLMLYKNQPFDRVVYSSVIVQRVDNGWAVYGYSTVQPYFNILISRTSGTKIDITAGGTTVRVPNQYSDIISQVPYGYVFTNQTMMVDFLLSYGALLERQGMIFDARENGKTLNWNQMAQEFLYWAGQGWGTGSIIALNPASTELTIIKPQAIVDSVIAQTPENLILDQNRATLPVRDLVVERLNNTFKITSQTAQTISYLDARYTNYETLIVLDNVSIFNDLIYDPATGARQSRVNVSSYVSADWNGQLDAQGFILNNKSTIEQWQPNRKYAKGEIVLYKNNYWSAQTIVQPAVEFRYSDWVKSDYTKIQGGLLENIPNKANQLANSYNTNTANLETDQDLLSYGLIGFRPRTYMSALNLDDVSQVNVYQQFLKDKGTIRSVRLLGNANLGKEVAEYEVYENWAIQRATYGANANRSFIELNLNEADLRSDPSVVQVIEPQQYSDADQKILLENVWRESFKLTSTDILPTTTTLPTDSALPSAGYVNLDDVDITVFSLLGQLSIPPNVLETVGVGTTIWAAKSNSYDWNIYRCSTVNGYLTSLSSNLNQTATGVFTKPHGLSVGDVIIIRLFNDAINGVYKVLAVPNLTSIVIELSLLNSITGVGIAYRLQTMRVAQASDAVNLPYVNELVPGARVWVDNNGFDRWTVLEKQRPFDLTQSITPTAPVSNSLYGTSVAQGHDNIIAMIGSPGVGSGAVYPLARGISGNYEEASTLTLNAVNVAGYGSTVDIGYQNWCAAGASQSNNNQGYASVIYRLPSTNTFEQRQLLVAPDQDFGQGQFGFDVSISQDERWMYVSAPAHNKVYAYGRVDFETQEISYVTDGATRIFNYNQNIQITADEQINVVLNNQRLTYNTDYTVNATSVVLTDIPPAGLRLIIGRKTGQEFVGDGSTTGFDLLPYLATVTDIFSFTVTIDGILQRPFVDYDYNVDSTTDNQTLVFNSAPTAGQSIVVTSKSYFAPVQTLTIPGLAINAQFGHSVSTTTDGRQVIVGAPVDNNTGSVYVFDRGVIRYTVTNPSQLTYTLPAGSLAPISVLVNGRFLTNSANFINGEFSVSGSTVTLSSTVDLNVGDIVEIENNMFNLIQNFEANTPFETADFGHDVDICPNNCSIYVGAPNDGTTVPGAGSVDRRVNQARVYGVIQSTNAYPTLTPGQTIRIQNIPVVLSDPPSWNINLTWTAGDLVISGGYIYLALRNVPSGTAISDTAYWREVSWADVMAKDIVAAAIPNITATANNGILTINVINNAAAVTGAKLNLLPGLTGTLFEDLGFDLYAYTQTIVSPNPTPTANFGSAVFIDSEADNLVVGAPRGNLYEPVTFDGGSTYFDDRSTIFSTTVPSSGVVYTFDYLPSAHGSISNPGKFVFGQQVYDSNVKSLDAWGTSISYVTGKLMVGSPGSDVDDSTYSELNYGRAVVFDNPTKKPAWTPIHTQQPVVDVYLLNSVYMYDKLQSSETHFFDFFDPLQGKILGAARQNIDYIGAVDPAKYNVGTVNNNGNFWGNNRVGEIWWDTNSVRFIDPNQDDITYASRRWGQVFPGSQIEVYQWVESTVPPVQYTGPGIPYSTTSYTVQSRLTVEGIFETLYYFWVKDIDSIATTAGKTLSTVGIARYIENPRSSGIPYIAALNSSTVAIYNGLQFISAQDTILHIDYDREYNTDNIHTEFELILQDDPEAFLSAGLYRKLQDSFCGVNTVGAKVPDPMLSPAERYGIQFRPRQSMFVDRFSALKNYLQRANTILKNYPIVETRKFNLLNSQEPEPNVASGEWNKRLLNIQQLSYQDLREVPVGYRYLVVSDASNGGLWTIYTVTTGPSLLGSPKQLTLTRVQTYDTRKYWNYINWYQPGYNSNVVPVAEVPNYPALATISVPVGSSVKVTANAQGKFEIYLRTDIGWDRVGLEDGTIEFSNTLWDYQTGRFGFDVEVFDAQYFDQEPTTETRKIIQAINEELFIDDLAIDRNCLLVLIFEYILSEFQAPEWLTKTSLINVEHKIRSLEPFQIYRQDNQEFVLDYIQEVKPYHVQIKEFNLTYDGFDQYFGTMTDFDVPAYYNTSLEIPQYVSPILLPYTQSSAVGTGTPNNNSDTPPSAELWSTFPYNQWFNNYLLSVEDVVVVDSGVGYREPPVLTVTGECVVPAELEAVINSVGQVIGVNVINPGSGYKTTAVVTVTGGNGIGARVVAVMGNSLVRNIKTTIKYDRYQYQSDIVNWQPNVNYDNGTLVRYVDQVWSANSSDSTAVNGATFNPEQWVAVDADTLSGVDRTRGFYAPGPNEPGLDLPLLIDGLDYPGVQVMGPGFNQNTGYDVGNFDINPFDNIAYGPEGRPTYDPAILDAIYQSDYFDPYLGVLPAPAYNGAPPNQTNAVVVDGGAYIDTYSSHAPEELIPGSEFDTLDLRVYTRPGSDWELNGHGFAEEQISYVYNSTVLTYSFDNLIPYPVSLIVSNDTTEKILVQGVDYTVDWVNRTVSFVNNVANGNEITMNVYGLGGGNQLYRQNIVGNAIIENKLFIPVSYDEIQEIAIFVNGELINDFAYDQQGTGTLIEFNNVYTNTDMVTLTAIGPTTINGTTVNYSWSTPVTQEFVGTGSLTYTLSNSLAYSNPINLIVTVNGVRARTAAGAEYIADGSSAYPIPERLGFSQALIADNEVLVYINDIPQILGVDFTVESWTGDQRNVVFTVEPEVGSKINLGITTNTQAWVNGNQLVFNPTQGLIPVLGDTITVTTWNDTRQQDILTLVYVGPITTGITVTEGYDDTDFDVGTVTFAPGSFDYAAGEVITVNDLQLGRVCTDPSRLIVTKNGNKLTFGVNYSLNSTGTEVIVHSGILSPTDVVMITQVTESVVPNAMAFRIFQDMRGVQATYRITAETTTQLAQGLSDVDDIIYVDNASALGEPELEKNIWGILTINGERIMYRNIDYVNNTVSGLRRGTAGTAAASHEPGAFVYDLGRGNLMPAEFQNYIVSATELANGTQTVFVAQDITSTLPLANESVEVYVGGSRVTTGYTITSSAPVTVEFATAPESGVDVTILVRRGVTWYEPGAGTPSNGVALQDTNTQAARFLRGL